MNDNNLYFYYVDEICEKLKEKKFEDLDEAFDYYNDIKNNYMNDFETTLDEIFGDFCYESDLKWKDDIEEGEQMKRILKALLKTIGTIIIFIVLPLLYIFSIFISFKMWLIILISIPTLIIIIFIFMSYYESEE